MFIRRLIRYFNNNFNKKFIIIMKSLYESFMLNLYALLKNFMNAILI